MFYTNSIEHITLTNNRPKYFYISSTKTKKE